MNSVSKMPPPDAKRLQRKKDCLSKVGLAILIFFIILMEGLGCKTRFTWTLFLLAGVFFAALEIRAFFEGRKAERKRCKGDLKIANKVNNRPQDGG